MKSVRRRYVPETGAVENRGSAVIDDGRIEVWAPKGYVGPTYVETPKKSGYSHCFLRPYQSAMLGRWKRGKGISRFWNLKCIVYVFVDAAPLDGLRCAGAVSIARARKGYTFSFFPAVPRNSIEKSEIDHLTAHIDFADGMISADKFHAKVRARGMELATEELQMERIKRDEFHFAFEVWTKDVRYMDPAGFVSSTRKTHWTAKQDIAQLKACIARVQPVTLGCSMPTTSGLTPLNRPILLRVGVLTEAGRTEKGGIDKAISKPHASKATGTTRIHRYKEISKLDNDWPRGVSLFMELGTISRGLPNDYMFPDVSRSSFQKLS